mgnify:FL=1
MYKRQDLYFKKGIRNEDTDWIARMLIYAERFEWYDKPFYVYRKGHETAQTSQKMKYYMVNDLKNIIIEYILHLIFCNESLSLMKHKQILVCDEQKVIFHAVCFPITCCPAIMLFLYDDFL